MARFVPRIFYGWWIVLAGTVAQMLQGGLYLYGFSLFFMPLIDEFGWTRAALSSVFAFSRLEAGFLGPLEGWLVDKFGPRRIMLLGVPIIGLGFVLMSFVNSFWTFAVVFFVFIATGSSLGLTVPCYTATANWFIRRRSTAMGFLSVGTGLGGGAVLLLAWVISQYGWRAGAVAIGITVIVLGLPLGLVMRHRPEPYGYLPDGIKLESAESRPQSVAVQGGPQAGVRLPISKVNFTAGEAIRTRGFWLLTVAFAIRQMAVGAVAVHLIPLFISIGFSPEVAATLLAALSLMSIVGRLGYGWLGDIFNKRYVMAVTLASMTVGMFLLVGVQDLWQAAIYLLIYAPAYGGGSPLMPALRGEFFGRKAFGTIQGTMLAFQMWGIMAGPLIAGYIYDILGSYRLAFLIFAVANLVSVGLVLMARRPRLESRSTPTC